MTKVSILLPVRDAGWLSTCIASVMRQTFPDFELLIGDDSGGDDVAAVVGRWQDARIVYVKNNVPLGGVANRNRLLTLAQGEFVKILSGRDFLYANAVSELVRALEKTGAPLAFHNQRLVDAYGLVTDSPIAVPPGFTDVTFQILTQYIVAQRDNFIGEGSNMMFVRDALAGRDPAFGIDQFEFRSLGMLALSIQLALERPIVGVGVFGSASRLSGAEGKENTMDEAFHLFEWEILQRWALDNGYLPHSAWPNLADGNLKAYTKVTPGWATLDPLIALIANPGPGPFLSEAFKRAVENAYAWPQGR